VFEEVQRADEVMRLLFGVEHEELEQRTLYDSLFAVGLAEIVVRGDVELEHEYMLSALRAEHRHAFAELKAAAVRVMAAESARLLSDREASDRRAVERAFTSSWLQLFSTAASDVSVYAVVSLEVASRVALSREECSAWDELALEADAGASAAVRETVSALVQRQIQATVAHESSARARVERMLFLLQAGLLFSLMLQRAEVARREAIEAAEHSSRDRLRAAFVVDGATSAQDALATMETRARRSVEKMEKEALRNVMHAADRMLVLMLEQERRSRILIQEELHAHTISLSLSLTVPELPSAPPRPDGWEPFKRDVTDEERALGLRRVQPPPTLSGEALEVLTEMEVFGRRQVATAEHDQWRDLLRAFVGAVAALRDARRARQAGLLAPAAELAFAAVRPVGSTTAPLTAALLAPVTNTESIMTLVPRVQPIDDGAAAQPFEAAAIRPQAVPLLPPEPSSSSVAQPEDTHAVGSITAPPHPDSYPIDATDREQPTPTQSVTPQRSGSVSSTTAAELTRALDVALGGPPADSYIGHTHAHSPDRGAYCTAPHPIFKHVPRQAVGPITTLHV